ncbi:hypothetical protein [Rhodoblastus sp.]|jgi:ABC-type cobalamin transport system ATPase subunit|uniref:hypothetical protein n=1 Tax=Rhodoblastus sp. TaxID=1962975 RepID=UPI00260005BC|nr:hypothetical protein [Rhodoblastus sp.]
MIIGWWRRRKELRARINAEARVLIAERGDAAYHVARSRALEYRLHKVVDPDRTPDHWDRVRFAIRCLQPAKDADTATRYLRSRDARAHCRRPA